MVRRVILGVICVGLLALAYVGYKNWSFKRAMLSGEVSGGAGEMATRENSAVSPGTERPVGQPKLAGTEQAAPAASKEAAAVSAQDTISPQPPNGTVFAGTGHFQIYRQGNLTWRINTDTGQTCVLFATTEEWRNPLVLRNGCGNSAKQ